MVDSLYYLSFCMCTFFWIQCGNNASGTEQNYSKKVHLKQNRLYISSIPTQRFNQKTCTMLSIKITNDCILGYVWKTCIFKRGFFPNISNFPSNFPKFLRLKCPKTHGKYSREKLKLSEF